MPRPPVSEPDRVLDPVESLPVPSGPTALTAEIRTELSYLARLLVGLMLRLAVKLWARKDARAVDAITPCIVDLPTAILLRRDRLGNATAREHLRASVRAVLAVGPPPLR